MKKVYVTYIQEGKIKKGEVSEERYNQLASDVTITELTIYPSSLLMEQNYQAKSSNNLNTKKFLHG